MRRGAPACALRNPEWGVRDVEAVAEIAARHALELEQVIEMPANTLTVGVIPF
jgi:Protein of unknown function (DUF938)